MYKIIITSSDSKDILRLISKKIVLKNFSPCCHIIKDAESFYLWDGKLKVDNESLLLIKSHNKNVSIIKMMILEDHNYDVPEIIIHDFDIISENYKKWFDNCIGN